MFEVSVGSPLSCAAIKPDVGLPVPLLADGCIALILGHILTIIMQSKLCAGMRETAPAMAKGVQGPYTWCCEPKGIIAIRL